MHTSIYLVRHGQTTANRERRYQSWSDSPLTRYGQRQVAALMQRLRRVSFTVAISSTVARTEMILQLLAKQSPTTLCIPDARWVETHHGQWEGLTYKEVLARFPDEARERFSAGASGKASGGESILDVSVRGRTAWQELLERFPGGRILIASHATPIQLVLCHVFELAPEHYWRWRIDLGSMTCIDVYSGGSIVRMVNTVPRLGRDILEG
jgi:2,3-bisphosphoglycerate-dependent phosphoglycerate mutase/probable phosphoglycerate mutase